MPAPFLDMNVINNINIPLKFWSVTPAAWSVPDHATDVTGPNRRERGQASPYK